MSESAPRGGRGEKGSENFCVSVSAGGAKPRRFAVGLSDWIFSGIFDKIGSSGVV